MKKKLTLIMFTLILVISCIGPVPALAANPNTPSDSQSVPFATEYTYYFKIVDGQKYYRIWNVSYGRWETPWLPC